MARHFLTTRTRRSGLAALACVLAAAVWQGCTATKDNYTTLSFFFDGVPDPNLATSTIDPKTGEIRERGTVSLHKPFEKEQCSECHGGQGLLDRNSSFVCMKCHENQLTKHQRMHGPVAAGACLWCHHPHESLRAHLMRDTDRKVCGQCHIVGALDAVREPAHADEKRACLECHSGHGGPKVFMLKVDALPETKPLPAITPPGSSSADEAPAVPTAPPGGAPVRPATDEPIEIGDPSAPPAPPAPPSSPVPVGPPALPLAAVASPSPSVVGGNEGGR
jgi:predicted CXXCH cytochrome family protein